MMALYTNKVDVFDCATLLACDNYVARKRNGVFYHPSFAVVLTVKGKIR